MACAAPTSWAAVASTPNSNARSTSASRTAPDAVTSNSFRAGSTDSCCVAAVASLTEPSCASSTSPALSASSARGTCGGSATVTTSSPAASAALRSSPRNRTGATATDSTTGPGTHQRPSRSAATTRSTGVASMPSYSSATISAVTRVGERGPHLAAVGGVTFGPRPDRGGDVGGAQRGIDARGEIALLIVEFEVHLACPFGSRGRPSNRSAMMLR